MSIRQYSHPRMGSGEHLDLITSINTTTKITNRYHEVGEPWRTPIVDVITVEPKMLAVLVYVAINAPSIVTPSSIKISSNLLLGTRSDAFQKSTKTTNNFCFLRMNTLNKS